MTIAEMNRVILSPPPGDDLSGNIDEDVPVVHCHGKQATFTTGLLTLNPVVTSIARRATDT